MQKQLSQILHAYFIEISRNLTSMHEIFSVIDVFYVSHFKVN